MRKVIVTTDDAALYEILRAELDTFGFEALWAIDGQETLDLVSAVAPAAALIDRRVQIFPLWELCELLRGHPDLPREFPLILISDEELNRYKLEIYRITSVISKAHDTALFRELLSRCVQLEV